MRVFRGVRPVLAGTALVLAAGFHAPAAADTGPIVHAWGYNIDGQVGNGTNDNPVTRPIPMVSAGGRDVVQTSGVYGPGSYALHADGSLWTWGYGSRPIPEPVPGLPPVRQVSSGFGHTLAVGRDGSVWAWGGNDFGELGDGTTTRSATPVKVPVTGVVQAAAGGGFSLVLKSNGEAFAWGLNRFGQLGDGTTTQRATPIRVGVPYGITQVSATGEYGVALRYDGSVWSWGYNRSGELGDGTTTDRLKPVRVDRHVAGVTEISAGGGHTLALAGDGTVWAWGRNWAGQLGDGTLTDRATPVHLGLSGITHVSAAPGQSLAVGSDGRLRYWGDNTYGQAGNGVANPSAPVTSPAVVEGLTGVVTASAGITVLAVAAPGSVVVPDLTGTLGTATAGPLLAVGLLPGDTATVPDTRLCDHVGHVVGQAPQPGSVVAAGSKVGVVVAVRPAAGCF
ncbi:MAG: hypothetical protein HOY71_42265 [Nonomuraea sp.]|nr:hypothetical protein [Nonomuraea sp.]